MQPTFADLERLEAFLQAAMSALGDIRWDDMYPEYPEAVSALMEYIAVSPWCDFDYDPQDAERILGHMENANMEEVRSAITAMCRYERFCSGGWERLLNDGSVASAVGRARTLLTA